MERIESATHSTTIDICRHFYAFLIACSYSRAHEIPALYNTFDISSKCSKTFLISWRIDSRCQELYRRCLVYKKPKNSESVMGNESRHLHSLICSP